MQSSYSDSLEDMALNNSDRDWIRLTIEESHRLKGWARTGKNIREWSLPSVATALLIFFLVQWGAYTEFRTHTQDRLDHIESSLRVLRAPIEPREILKEVSRLDLKQFAQSLPALRKAEVQPVSDVKPLAQELHAIAEKLRQTNPETPEYWPTVLQFLHFATAGISSDVPPPGAIGIRASNAIMNNNLFEGVTILLDGGSVSDTMFKNSRVIFTENPVRMTNVQFSNCVFELPVTDTPNKYLRDAAKVILASSLESVTFNTPS